MPTKSRGRQASVAAFPDSSRLSLLGMVPLLSAPRWSPRGANLLCLPCKLQRLEGGEVALGRRDDPSLLAQRARILRTAIRGGHLGSGAERSQAHVRELEAVRECECLVDKTPRLLERVA